MGGWGWVGGGVYMRVCVCVCVQARARCMHMQVWWNIVGICVLHTQKSNPKLQS